MNMYWEFASPHLRCIQFGFCSFYQNVPNSVTVKNSLVSQNGYRLLDVCWNRKTGLQLGKSCYILGIIFYIHWNRFHQLVYIFPIKCYNTQNPASQFSQILTSPRHFLASWTLQFRTLLQTAYLQTEVIQFPSPRASLPHPDFKESHFVKYQPRLSSPITG